MRVNGISLHNFRNYGDGTTDFSGGVNIICGENAAGKTNILEAIFYYAAGKSFRNCKDRELIRFGCDSAETEMLFDTPAGQKKMSVSYTKLGKRAIRLGQSPALKTREFMGLFRAVVFTPDHLSLVKGAPETRRRFLDLAICQSFPRYAPTVQEYNRILLQKNALLKSACAGGELLDIYNERLSLLAAVITVNRAKYVSRLIPAANGFLSEMSREREELTAVYRSQCGVCGGNQEEVKNAYRKLFSAHMADEREKGFCVCGVQKDDVSFYINGKSIRLYGSQGQQRSAVLAMKLAEGELSASLTGDHPVYLLDDILSELDNGRREFILSMLSGRQVIITGCGGEVYDIAGANRICVSDGKILPR